MVQKGARDRTFIDSAETHPLMRVVHSSMVVGPIWADAVSFMKNGGGRVVESDRVETQFDHNFVPIRDMILRTEYSSYEGLSL